MSKTGDPKGPPSGSLAGDRRGDGLFIAVSTAVLAVVLVFNALNVSDEHVRSGHALAAWEPFVWEGSSGLYLIAVCPVVMALTRRFWPAAPPRAPKLVVHAVAAVLFSVAHMLLIGVVRWGVYVLAKGHYDPWAPLRDWPYEGRKDVLIYASYVAIYAAWRAIRAPRIGPSSGSAQVLEVRDGARRHFVDVADVVWVEAAGNYVELHRGGSGLLHRASLAEMERRLQTAGFVRIHRSRLVRREAVAGVESKPTGDFVVRLRDGRELAGSRRYRKPLLAD